MDVVAVVVETKRPAKCRLGRRTAGGVVGAVLHASALPATGPIAMTPLVPPRLAAFQPIATAAVPSGPVAALSNERGTGRLG